MPLSSGALARITCGIAVGDDPYDPPIELGDVPAKKFGDPAPGPGGIIIIIDGAAPANPPPITKPRVGALDPNPPPALANACIAAIASSPPIIVL
jgi:hypothetical protein